MVKNPPAMQETWVRSLGSIPGLERSPGEENGYPLQYSGLENSGLQPMDLQRVGLHSATFTFTLQEYYEIK